LSSALAAPALAGIPITHRGIASSFAVITGHHEHTYGPLLDGFAPGALTLVVLMGVRKRGPIAARLIAGGWAPSTPAALVMGAATDKAWRWIGPLDALGAVEIPAASSDAPGMLVIGEVVSLSERIMSRVAATQERTSRGTSG